MTTYVVLGATGHVGGAVARNLLQRGETVTVVTRDAAHASGLADAGAQVSVADLHDVDALAHTLSKGTRAFLLNPPGDTAGDSDAEEIATVDAILAVANSVQLDRVVAHSTYGATPGDRIGDASTLYRLEEGVRALPAATAIIRAAYYYTNWDLLLGSAREDGVIRTPYAADFCMPMVSPNDLGRVAADLLTQDQPASGIHHVEGPERYSPQQVADAFGAALGRPVEVETVPRKQWEEMFRSLGFSAASADAYARMTRHAVDDLDLPDDPVRGSVTLQEHTAALVTAPS